MCERKGCGEFLTSNQVFRLDSAYLCRDHYIELKNKEHQIDKPTEVKEWEHHFDIINNPEHYHKYEIDTITFLEQGFPPEVARGFALGSAVKYLQRSELKNGLQDLEKAEFYTKKLIEYKKKEAE